jgi:Flp pilus assembly protein TadG
MEPPGAGNAEGVVQQPEITSQGATIAREALTPSAGRRRRGWRAFRESRRGVVALEFVLLAPVYFLMIFGIIELALVSFNASTLKSGVAAAARQVKVGKAQCFKDKDAIDAICGASFLADCKNRVTVERSTFALGWGGAAASTSFKNIKPGDIVLLSATYDWPVITPILEPLLGDKDGKLPLTRSLIFKSEEFISAGSCP